MNKDQESKFDEAVRIWFTSRNQSSVSTEVSRYFWKACLEANGIGEEPRIPEGYFKIGEIGQGKTDEGWTRARICAIADRKNGFTIIAKPEDFSPIPAWKPKDGEAVLFYTRDPSCTLVGVYARGSIHAKDTAWPLEDCHYRQFDVDGHGKPWSEI